MLKGQLFRMQRLSSKGAQHQNHLGMRCPRYPTPGTIQAITDQWMPDAGHVYADLVGAPRLQLRLDKGMRPKPLANPQPGERFAAILPHLLPNAHPPVATDGAINGAPGNQHTFGNPQVAPHDPMFRNGGGEMALRQCGGCHNHQAGGIHVDPMHYAGPREFAKTGAMVEQPVNQGVVWSPRARMHHQARGLVDHKAMFVFVQNREINGLGDGPVFRRGGGAGQFDVSRNRQPFPAAHFAIRLARPPIDRQRALAHPSRQHRPGKAIKQRGGGAVGPLTGKLGRNMRGHLFNAEWLITANFVHPTQSSKF